MYDYMAACNADRLEKTALNYFGRKFSYRELFCEIDRAAAAFCKIGISSGTVVMAFALNTPECIVSIYALNRLGAIVDLQYADQSPREALENLQCTHARFILTADTFLPLVQDTLELGNFGTSVQVITVSPTRSLPPLKRLFLPTPRCRTKADNILSFDGILVGLHDPIPPGKADDPALIVHTSGTTGVPTGEIWMTSPSLMHGYYRDTDEDGDGLIIDESGTRWLRTGDLGELDQDGFLYLRGRIKRIYLAKGRNNSIYKLFPDRVERVILKCPYVLECAVVVKSADGIFHVPVAFAAVQECTVDQIQRYCKDHLPEYMIPEDIRIIDHIPHTVTGKADYHLLESLVEEESQQ